MKKLATVTRKFTLGFISFALLFILLGANNVHAAKEQLSAENEPAVPAQLMLDQQSERYNQIQIFDVSVGEVVRILPNSEKIQKQAKGWLKKVKEFAPEVQPDMKAKYIVRIPLIKPDTIKIGSQRLEIQEIFLFYYPDKEPLMLVFDSNRKPYIFHLKSNLKSFWKQLDIS